MTNDFLRGFMMATGLSREEAGEQWAAFSRQLSDDELAELERGGLQAGQEQGRAFREMYPDEDACA